MVTVEFRGEMTMHRIALLVRDSMTGFNSICTLGGEIPISKAIEIAIRDHYGRYGAEAASRFLNGGKP